MIVKRWRMNHQSQPPAAASLPEQLVAMEQSFMSSLKQMDRMAAELNNRINNLEKQVKK